MLDIILKIINFFYSLKLSKNRYFLKFIITILICFIAFWGIMNLSQKYFNGKFQESDNYFVAISQVSGGLLGGIFTLLGVLLTLNEQNKERKEEWIQSEKRQLEQNRLQNIPVFQYTIDNENKSKKGKIYMCDCNDFEDVEYIPLNICIKNIGLGSARNIYYQLFIDNKTKSYKQEIENSLIPVNDKIELNYYVCVKKSISNLIVKLIIYYDDLLGNHYMQELDGNVQKSITIYDSTKEKKEEYSISFSKVKDYLVVENDYIYEIPKETIDNNKNIKVINEKIDKLSKQKNYDEIITLVKKFEIENQKNIFSYLPKAYKLVNFYGGGGGITDIVEINSNEYLITLSVSTIQKHGCEFNFNILLNVNLQSKKVTVYNIELITNTIDVCGIIRFLAKREFIKDMKKQKRYINKI